jgi:hypothetical protein
MLQITIDLSSTIQLLVDFDYQPAERADTGPEACYPGCPEAVEIDAVTMNGHNITSLLSDRQLAELEGDIWLWIDNERANNLL